MMRTFGFSANAKDVLRDKKINGPRTARMITDIFIGSWLIDARINLSEKEANDIILQKRGCFNPQLLADYLRSIGATF